LIPRLVDLGDVNGTPLTVSGQLPVWDQAGKYFDFTKNINDYQAKADPLGDYKETLKAATTTGNTTFDLSLGTVQRWILDADRQLTMPANPGAYGKSFVLVLEPATHAASWEVTTPKLKWLTSDGEAPTLVTDADLVNVLTFIWDNIDSRWLGFLGGKETA
jgi:hypothetical protein